MINQNKTTTITQPVSLISSALRAIKRLCIEQNIPLDEGLGLRIGIKGGGCSGFSYEIGFDDFKEGDEISEIGGLKVFIQKSHTLYLKGVEVDWNEGLDNRGFTFNNPNASSTCGCGSSFAT